MLTASLLENIYHNFYSVCSLIPAVFMASIAYVFLTIPRKSVATFHLGIASLFLVFFFLGYFITAILYHPIAAFHRWITVIAVFPAGLHIAQFLLALPVDNKRRVRRLLLFSQYGVGFVLTVKFFLETFQGDRRYHFAGHYWDFDADATSQLIAFFVIIYVLVFILSGLWKAWLSKNSDRWVILGTTIILGLSIMTPAIANAMSRDGLLDRGTYQVTQDLFTVLGFFFSGILYLNHTRDRSTFMVKIIGISLATLLVLFQGLSYFSLRDLERSYDAHKVMDLQFLVKDHHYSPQSLEYLAEYTIKNNKLKYIRKNNELVYKIDQQNMKVAMANTYLYERLLSLTEPRKANDYFKANDDTIEKENADFALQFQSYVYNSHSHFAIYQTLLGEKIRQAISLSEKPALQLRQYLPKINRSLGYYYNKMGAFSDNDFLNNVLEYFQTKDKVIYAKLKSIGDLMPEHFDQSQIKAEILRYFLPFEPAKTRNYRVASEYDHFTSFMFVDLINMRILEAGYNYRDYREYQHSLSQKYIVMLAVIFLVVVIGFQFFFLGALVHPLTAVVRGMKEVRKGNLDIALPIKVEDEIGFIARTFNSMVTNIRAANKKLADYAENLEAMVKARTVEIERANIELRKTRDALWGEMELARKLQTVLLPNHFNIPNYEIAAYLAPAEEVGGDYYDVLYIENRLWLVIGDVSGHGISAGLIMMMVKTAIESVLNDKADMSPSYLLEIVNKTIAKNIRSLGENKYMTITVFSCYDNGKFYFSGLHQDVLIYRQKSQHLDSQPTNGMWIGIIEDIKGMVHNDFFDLAVGDTILLFTDGLTEAMKDGVMYGDNRLKRVFCENALLPCQEIREKILQSLVGFQRIDDITMLIVRRLA